MADAQADNAQGQQGGQAPAAPDPKAGGGEQQQFVPLPRFNEVYGELKQTRDELAQTRQQLAELAARQQAPQDQLDDEDPDKTVEKSLQRLLTKNNEQYNLILIRMADKLDAMESRQVSAGLPADDVKAAEELRANAMKNGVSLSRKDALAYRLGLKALEEREKSAADEAARLKANVYAFTGQDRPGSVGPPPETDLDNLPPSERAEALAKRLGDTPI